MACIDYSTVWTVMNDLDETVQNIKIINQFCDELIIQCYNTSDDDELLQTMETLRGFSKFMIRDLESKSIRAWNETVVKLNPNSNYSNVVPLPLEQLQE
tara:strand:+ start:424 stop:720 length:297 start_codon:yes stop_codon:yes gene_type:complete